MVEHQGSHRIDKYVHTKYHWREISKKIGLRWDWEIVEHSVYDIDNKIQTLVSPLPVLCICYLENKVTMCTIYYVYSKPVVVVHFYHTVNLWYTFGHKGIVNTHFFRFFQFFRFSSTPPSSLKECICMMYDVWWCGSKYQAVDSRGFSPHLLHLLKYSILFKFELRQQGVVRIQTSDRCSIHT